MRCKVGFCDTLMGWLLVAGCTKPRCLDSSRNSVQMRTSDASRRVERCILTGPYGDSVEST